MGSVRGVCPQHPGQVKSRRSLHVRGQEQGAGEGEALGEAGGREGSGTYGAPGLSSALLLGLFPALPSQSLLFPHISVPPSVFQFVFLCSCCSPCLSSSLLSLCSVGWTFFVSNSVSSCFCPFSPHFSLEAPLASLSHRASPEWGETWSWAPRPHCAHRGCLTHPLSQGDGAQGALSRGGWNPCLDNLGLQSVAKNSCTTMSLDVFFVQASILISQS